MQDINLIVNLKISVEDGIVKNVIANVLENIIADEDSSEQLRRDEKTGLYKDVFMNTEIFPAGLYSIYDIYDIFLGTELIPDEHFENRPDVNYPLWKNYIHAVRPKIKRITFLGQGLYQFE